MAGFRAVLGKAISYNVSPATITRDGKFAEAVDSIAAPVSEYARSIFFDSRFIGGESTQWQVVALCGVSGRAYTPNLWGILGHAPRETPYFQHRHFGAVIALHVADRTYHLKSRAGRGQVIWGSCPHPAFLSRRIDLQRFSPYSRQHHRQRECWRSGQCSEVAVSSDFLLRRSGFNVPHFSTYRADNRSKPH